MLWLRKSERTAFEEHIVSLKEEINWLRSCIPWAVPAGTTRPVGVGASPPLVVPHAVDEQDDLPDPTRNALSPLTEEEEDVLEAYKRGDLDEEEAKAILRVLGHTAEIELS